MEERDELYTITPSQTIKITSCVGLGPQTCVDWIFGIGAENSLLRKGNVARVFTLKNDINYNLQHSLNEKSLLL